MNGIARLLLTKQTIYTIKDLAYLWNIPNENALKRKIYYYSSTGKLIRLRRGIFTVNNQEINNLELANKLISPSYVTFETVLYKEGINFQYDSRIYSATNTNSEESIGANTFIYRKLPLDVVFNRNGINEQSGIFIATAERAIVDTIYYFKGNFHFDNLDSVNLNKCVELSKLYNDKALINNICRLIDNVELK